MSTSLGENMKLESLQKDAHHPNNSKTNTKHRRATIEKCNNKTTSTTAKRFDKLHSSDSGKSSSCSPVLLDCSFDSGIAGVLMHSNDMKLHKRIQQYQCIILALERDQEYYVAIRNRLSKITNRKKKKTNENEIFCNVCCADINPEDEKTFVKCCVCQKHICRSNKCADWLPKISQWECELCQTSKESLAQTSSWVADQLSFHQEKLTYPPRAISEIFIPISECNDSSIHFESVSQIGANSSMITAEQKLKIREYVEEMVEKILGGNLNKIAVNQLSKSENYLSDPKTKHSHNEVYCENVRDKGSANHFTDISETRLRQMIQKIIAETLNLPPLSNGHAVSEIALDRHSKAGDNRSFNNGNFERHRTEHYFEPAIYQDLLATAVLNKIVDKQINNNRQVSERDIVSGDDGGGSCDVDGNTDVINANVIHVESDQNLNIEKASTSSGSSVEPRSDCSFPEIEQILNTNDDKSSEILRNSDRDSVMSDYLAAHMIPLPDLNAISTESDEDDCISVTSSAVGDGTWEKNWLFKKKKSTLSGSVTANSIGMLVPDPKEDVRAQIGDKTADEVSDLSELGSDTDDSFDSLRLKLEPINDRLINKHLIGGQNNKIVLDELIECGSMISNTMTDNLEPCYTDTCNEHVIDVPIENEAINDNVNQQTNAMARKLEHSKESINSVVHERPNSNSLTGSIAEREYKKWYNAVEMPNNPYAPEALKKRISGSQERFIDLPNISPTKDLNPLAMLNTQKLDSNENSNREGDYKRYSRDYYINNSVTTPQISPKRELSSTPEAMVIPEPLRGTSSSAEFETQSDLYKAIPVQVEESNSSPMDSVSLMLTESETNATTTSDDSDTIKIYNFEKQETSSVKKDSAVPLETQGQQAIVEDHNTKETPSSLVFSRTESTGNVITPTRGATPMAFKFLQPKRKLLEPNQLLSMDECEPKIVPSSLEKPVIEAEVAKALPSVKALARAFLMTTNTTQPEKLWLRKARTLSQGEKKPSNSPKRSLDHLMRSELSKPEDDLTITSDLSSLETDSSSVDTEMLKTSDLSSSAVSTTNDPSHPTDTSNISPIPVRQGVLKNNIAFFENLKNK